MTPKQESVLNFIRRYIKVRKISPSYDEIASGVGLSGRPAVCRHVNVLD